jgi:aldose 1-epimerase
VAGPAPLDEWTLELPASTFAQVDGPRLLPGPVVEVTGRDFDFRAGRRLGAIEIDHAFGGVEWRTGPDGQPRATARVNDPSGSGVAISWDSACPWVQVHTADRPLPAENRLGLAVEPMTCPPDAFNSAEDLVVLEPGQTHRAQWTVSAW